MTRRLIALVTLAGFLAAANTASAQSVDWSAALGSAAVSLARSIDMGAARVRITVIPVRSSGAPLDPAFATQVTTGLTNAFLAAMRPANRPFEMVEGAELSKWLTDEGLSGTSPVDPASALKIGTLTGADYVVIGTVSPSRTLTFSDARLEVELFNVKAKKSAGTSSVTLSLATTSNGNITERPGFEPKKRSEGWTSRRIAITSGIAMSLAAGGLALTKELQLRHSVNQMRALPPDAADQWQALLDKASLQIKSRNFWQSVAIGVGGVTAGYLITSSSASIKPGPVVMRVSKNWMAAVDPRRLRVLLVRAF